MSNKRCIYKNCTNTGAGEATLFSFPKDKSRQNAWLELAGRSNYTLQKSDCLCEEHFGRQFISSNQRRKVLVGIALPFSFDQSENYDEQEIDALDDSDRLEDEQQIFDEDEETQEDINSYSSNSVVEHLVIDNYSPMTIVCDRKSETNGVKRKKTENLSPNGPGQQGKTIKIESQCKEKNGIESTKPKSEKGDIKIHNVVTIVDHPDVSTFNIRGEEFIQMPLSVYLEEKSKLLSIQKTTFAQEISKMRVDLETYKKVVVSIQNQLKTLP